MIALKTAATCSACHGNKRVRGLDALEIETIVGFAWIKWSPAKRQGQAVLHAEGQAHEQFPDERGRLEVRLDHQERHVAIRVLRPLTKDLDAFECLAEQVA